MKKMKQVAPTALVVAAVVAAAFAWVTALGFYAHFPRIELATSSVLWIAAIICGVQGFIMRKKLQDNAIGLDRSQVNPMTVAFSGVLGQAVAWIGAIFAGAYGGTVVFLVFNAGHLVVAQEDTPGAIVGMLGGVLAAVAGKWLEQNCLTPPEDGGVPGE